MKRFTGIRLLLLVALSAASPHASVAQEAGLPTPRQLAPERIRHRQNVGRAGGQVACRQRREPRQRWPCDLFFANEMRLEDAGESLRGGAHGAGNRGGFLERGADLTV